MSASLKRLSERVWYLPAHPDPKKVQPVIGIVLGDEETALIDAGNTPALAERLQDQLNQIGAPPVTKIIYTHHHWDHVFGACAYSAQVIAHSRCLKRLKSEAAKLWSRAFLRAEVARDETLATMAEILQTGVRDWQAFEINLPTVTFDKELTVSGVGYQLELRHVGGRHADDSITVKVVGEGSSSWETASTRPHYDSTQRTRAPTSTCSTASSTRTAKPTSMDTANQSRGPNSAIG